MNYKKWIFPEVEKQMVSEVAEDCGLDPLTVFIAFARGMSDPYEIEQFMEKEPEFSDPYEYSGMSEAVERINIALESDEKILVFGDYDCDGVTATAILTSYLKKRGADAEFRLPDRESEGYGISVQAVEQAAEDGYSLIITVDNGITAVAEAARAAELGIDMVITDHHIPKEELPNAAAVVDPQLDKDGWLFTKLCGAGVAFKLVCALDGRPCEEMIYEYADLAALGTIADLVPLVGENRVIADVGLKMINRKLNYGVRALIEAAGSKYMNAHNAAFTLCPRINAAGRMAKADTAVRMFLSDSYDEALYFAQYLDRLNSERQSIEQEIFESACDIIEKNGYNKNRVIVVDGDGWHVGVIGIAAAKLVEKYGRPCIVIGKRGDASIGSGRSTEGFSLFGALLAVSDTLVKFGGHEMAAGLIVREEDIPAFRKAVNRYAARLDKTFSTVKIDCRVKPRALTVDVAKALRAFEPYGEANPVPVFAVTESAIIGIQPLAGGKHIRLRLRRDHFDYNAVLFGTSPENFAFRIGDTVDLAVTLDVNVYNQTESVSIIVRAIRKSGLDERQTEEQLILLEKLYGGNLRPEEAARLIPERSDTAAVFRFIKSNPNVTEEMLANALAGTVPIGKLTVALDALTEVGVIKFIGGRYSDAEISGKADLDGASVLHTLKSIKGGENIGGI